MYAGGKKKDHLLLSVSAQEEYVGEKCNCFEGRECNDWQAFPILFMIKSTGFRVTTPTWSQLCPLVTV